jgi:hypothetical protein
VLLVSKTSNPPRKTGIGCLAIYYTIYIDSNNPRKLFEKKVTSLATRVDCGADIWLFVACCNLSCGVLALVQADLVNLLVDITLTHRTTPTPRHEQPQEPFHGTKAGLVGYLLRMDVGNVSRELVGAQDF